MQVFQNLMFSNYIYWGRGNDLQDYKGCHSLNWESIQHVNHKLNLYINLEDHRERYGLVFQFPYLFVEGVNCFNSFLNY